MATTKKFLSNQTKTHQGAPAYLDLTPEQKLRRSVLSCMLWEREAYESGDTIANRIKTFIPLVEPEKVANLAIEAREKMKLRHVPLLIVREMARIPSHRGLVAATLERVIQRADELTEFLAIYWMEGRQPVSKQVKKGLSKAFYKFNEYQFAKYNRGETVKFRDVLFLTHPKPRNADEDVLWKKIIANELVTPDTHESRAAAGMDKKENFEGLLRENKLGALALLRNLRGMSEVGVADSLIRSAILEMRTERILPFRFIAAQRYATSFTKELETSMFKCVEKHDKLEGKTVLLVDVSGSMDVALSERSDLSRMDAAAGLGVLLREICESVAIYTFSNNTVKVRDGRGFDLINAILKSQPHSCTYLGEALKTVNKSEGYDRIIVITDEQSHDRVGSPNGTGYVINVASAKNGVGYGEWNHIDGFSESVVSYILEYEKEFVNKQLSQNVDHIDNL